VGGQMLFTYGIARDISVFKDRELS
jgi:hypothetical protein